MPRERVCEVCGTGFVQGRGRARRWCWTCLPTPSEIGWTAYHRRYRELNPEVYARMRDGERQVFLLAQRADMASRACACGCGRSLEGRNRNTRYFEANCCQRDQYRLRPEVREAQRETNRRKRLAKVYGITLEEWDAMFAAQGSRCAACGGAEPDANGWVTDHCHTTGVVRGILCNPCNRALGFALESPERLLGLLTYCAAHVQAR